MNAYTIAGITLNGTTYRQLSNISVDPAMETVINSGGQVDAVFAAGMRQRPMCRFSSKNLALFLAAAGADGLAIGTTFDVFFAQLTHKGTRSYTACIKATFNDGLVVLRSVRAANGQEGEAEYEVYSTYDGTNAPLIFATGQTCPADSAGVAKFTNGPFKIGSTSIESQENTFDLGAQIGQYGIDGEVYDRSVCILNRRPTMRCRTLDLGALETAGEQGSSSAVTMFFRKMDNKGTRVAAATEEHVSFVGAASYVRAGQMSGNEGSEATGEIIADLVWDGSNAIVVIDATAAIA